MLGNLRISYRLLMIVGLSVLAVAAVAGLGLSALWNNLMEDRRGKLQDIVTVARRRWSTTIKSAKAARAFGR